ncbi:hypothetical protein ACLKA7_008374 [Drosophila subpalustris]
MHDKLSFPSAVASIPLLQVSLSQSQSQSQPTSCQAVCSRQSRLRLRLRPRHSGLRRKESGVGSQTLLSDVGKRRAVSGLAKLNSRLPNDCK